MLADPQSVTISGTATSLPRVDERPETFVYSNVTAGVDLFVTQKVAKDGRRRATLSLQKTVVLTDPLTGLKTRAPYSISVGVSYPQGVVDTDVAALYTGLAAALSASSNALLLKAIGGEK